MRAQNNLSSGHADYTSPEVKVIPMELDNCLLQDPSGSSSEATYIDEWDI